MRVHDYERQADHFDLLPFISIMLCLLGTLLLVTMSMASISLGAGAGEGWIPAPNEEKSAKTAVLIEWDGRAAVWHKGQTRIRMEPRDPNLVQIEGVWFTVTRSADGKTPSIEKADPPARGKLEELLDELEAKRDTHYALFAVRPSGFDSLQRFTAQFRGRRIDIGYEPIDQVKPVRLMTQNKEAQ
jgi:hypothetical protein